VSVQARKVELHVGDIFSVKYKFAVLIYFTTVMWKSSVVLIPQVKARIEGRVFQWDI
jgi:hypothetical protein